MGLTRASSGNEFRVPQENSDPPSKIISGPWHAAGPLCNPDLARAPSPPYLTVTVHHSTPILPSILTPRSEIFVSCNIASLLFIWLVGFSGCRPFA